MKWLRPILALGLFFALTSACAGSRWRSGARDYHLSRVSLAEDDVRDLEAVARLLAAIRFLHPGSASVAANWDLEYVDAVRSVLAERGGPLPTLERLLTRLAPSVSVYVEREHVCRIEGRGPVVFWEWLGPAVGWGNYRAGLGHSDSGASGSEFTPTKPSAVEVDIGGGLKACVPFALAGGGPEIRRVSPDVTTYREMIHASDVDPNVRLAALMMLWGALEYFYPYWENLPATTSDDMLHDGLLSWGGARTRRELELRVDEFLGRLQDGHAYNLLRRTGGAAPPIEVRLIEGEAVVSSVWGAAKGRVQPGDILTMIGGEPTNSVIESSLRRVSEATSTARRHQAVEQLLFGAPGTHIQVSLRRGSASTEVALERLDARRRRRGRPPGEAVYAEIAPGIHYVDLRRITPRTLDRRLGHLSKCRAIIFDLRGYPRAGTDPLPQLGRHDLESPQFWVRVGPGTDGRMHPFRLPSWEIAPRTPQLRCTVAFLADERAKSFAETYLAIVEHYQLGKIVGSPTAGTNGNVAIMRLPGALKVGFTGLEVRKHDGSRQQGVGVVPDVPATPTIESVRAGCDAVLTSAVDLFSNDDRSRTKGHDRSMVRHRPPKLCH